MNIEININVNLKPSEELMEFFTGLIHPVIQFTGPTVKKPDVVAADKMNGTVLLSSDGPSTVAPTEEPTKKKSKAEAKAELTTAVNAAKDIIPDKGVPVEPTETPKTLDEIKALCTEMAARQDFDTRKFLNELGYKRMSDIPVEEWNSVYAAAKKQEVPW